MVIEVKPELEARMRLVRVLLGTLDDYVPDPRVAVEPDSGPAPSKRIPCENCDRSGAVSSTETWECTQAAWEQGARPPKDGKGVWSERSWGGYQRQAIRHCPVCEGSGWRRRQGREEAWDDYVEQPISEAVKPTGVLGQHDRGQSIRMLDSQLRRLRADAQARAGVTAHEQYGWERQHRALDRHGSYVELRRVLDLLGVLWPEGSKMLRRAHSIEWEQSFRERIVVEVAEAWVAQTMRGPIRVPHWIMDARAEQRNETVASLAAQGLSAGVIARRLRLPKEKVRRLLKGMA